MVWYSTLEQQKTVLAIPDAVDDAQLSQAIAAVSRALEGPRGCNRTFYPQNAVSYPTALDSQRILLVEDLLAVSELATDHGLNRTYSTVWTTDQFDLEPVDAPLGPGSEPQPYWEIAVRPLSGMWFPMWRRAVRVTGTWGYSDLRETLSAALSADLDTSQTGVTVSDGSAFGTGDTIWIDSEQMFVSAIAADTLTVARAQSGYAAAAHTTGATIQRSLYPGAIGEACRTQVSHLFQVRNAPGGMIGSAEIGAFRVAPQWSPVVQSLLDSYRKRVIA